MSDSPRSLGRALETHAASARELAAVAEAIPPERWHQPLAEGKWTPAQVVQHLVLSYQIVLQELCGGAGMRVRTRAWQRLLLRLLLVPRLLAGGAFPKGARAPRETRPGDRGPEREEAIAAFRRAADEFDQAARACRPEQRVTHAYFGSAPVADGVLLCARHVEHHRQQLSAAG